MTSEVMRSAHACMSTSRGAKQGGGGWGGLNPPEFWMGG